MKSSIKWIVAGILAYLFFLIFRLPANQLVGRLTLPDTISVSGISGTIWSGSAEFISINGMAVSNLKWETGALPLLLGNLSLDIKAGNSRASDEISFSGPVSMSLLSNQHFSASDFRMFLPSGLVISQLPLPIPVNAGGRFRIDIDELDYQQQCTSLTGTGQWLNANVVGLGDAIQLGNFNADLSCIDGDTLIKVKEPNMFGLSADARVPANMNISVTGRFKPDPSLPKQVHDAALFFGQAGADGYYPITF